MRAKLPEIRSRLETLLEGEPQASVRATHKDLAQRLGASETMIGTALGQLEEAGLITRDRARSLITFTRAQVPALASCDPVSQAPLPVKSAPTPQAVIASPRRETPLSTQIARLSYFAIAIIVSSNAWHLASKATETDYVNAILLMAIGLACSLGAIFLFRAGAKLIDAGASAFGAVAYTVAAVLFSFNMLSAFGFAGTNLETQAGKNAHLSAEAKAVSDELLQLRAKRDKMSQNTRSLAEVKADQQAKCALETVALCRIRAEELRKESARVPELATVKARIETLEKSPFAAVTVREADASSSAIAGIVARLAGPGWLEAGGVRALFMFLMVIGLDLLGTFGLPISDSLKRHGM